MTLRTDHVAGATFLALGLLVFAVSGDLPFGTLASPGAGMMPKLVAAAMMIFAVAVIVAGAASQPLAAVDWSGVGHAGTVVVIAALAIAGYRWLGFLITMSLLVFALLVVIERRGVLPSAVYAVGLTVFAYWLFGKALRAPLERGLLWF